MNHIESVFFVYFQNFLKYVSKLFSYCRQSGSTNYNSLSDPIPPKKIKIHRFHREICFKRHRLKKIKHLNQPQHDVSTSNRMNDATSTKQLVYTPFPHPLFSHIHMNSNTHSNTASYLSLLLWTRSKQVGFFFTIRGIFFVLLSKTRVSLFSFGFLFCSIQTKNKKFLLIDKATQILQFGQLKY